MPIALLFGLAGVCLVWNVGAGIAWRIPLWKSLFPLAMFAVSAVIFAWLKLGVRAAEIVLYLGLWTMFTVFGMRLTYLAATFDFPLRDAALARTDQMLGFDWVGWYNALVANPILLNVLVFAYRSFDIQPIAIMIVLALTARQGRNREFIIAAFVALLITTAISIVLPAYGPEDAFGEVSIWHPILDLVRARSHVPVGYAGIITFPSFHACMAVIYTVSMRGIRIGFVAFGVANLAMLVSSVPIGNHYLVDLIAGCCVAVIALWFARLVPSHGALVGVEVVNRAQSVVQVGE